MPPKGWRKDAQGKYPSTSYTKEQECLTVDDLLFPKSAILRLAKEVTTSQEEGDVAEKRLMISSDVSLALQRSATVFVNHLLMFARELACKQDRKSCGVDDVLSALDYIGHGGLAPIVQSKLQEYQKARARQATAPGTDAADAADAEGADASRDSSPARPNPEPASKTGTDNTVAALGQPATAPHQELTTQISSIPPQDREQDLQHAENKQAEPASQAEPAPSPAEK